MRCLVGLVLVVAACNSYDEYCTGNVAHTCAEDDHGINCHDTDCGARFCVEAGGEALCALDAEPRPVCANATIYEDGACDGAFRIKCQNGYAVEANDCGDAALCEPSVRVCLARPGEDPRCVGTSGQNTSYCDGASRVACEGRYVTFVYDCTPKLCHDGPMANGGCVLSDTPDPRCQPSTVTFVCDGSLEIFCFDGYAQEITDCASANDPSCTCK